MTSDRPYRQALSVPDALSELRGGAAYQFDPRVVEVFCQAVERGDIAPQPTLGHRGVLWLAPAPG